MVTLPYKKIGDEGNCINSTNKYNLSVLSAFPGARSVQGKTVASNTTRYSSAFCLGYVKSGVAFHVLRCRLKFG